MCNMVSPDEFVEGESSVRLVVMLHAAGKTATSMVGIRRAVQADADTWLPALPIRRLLTRSRGAIMTNDLTRRLGQLVENREKRGGGNYEEIILVATATAPRWFARSGQRLWAVSPTAPETSSRRTYGRPTSAASFSLPRWRAGGTSLHR